jgi:hypothetical protein
MAKYHQGQHLRVTIRKAHAGNLAGDVLEGVVTATYPRTHSLALDTPTRVAHVYTGREWSSISERKKNPTRRVWKVEFHPAVGQTARLRQIVDRWDGKLNTTTYVATFAAADDAENATEQAANWGIAGRDTRVAKPKVVLVRRNPKTKSRARRDFERADRAYRSVASGRRSHIEFRDMLGPQTRDSEGHWMAREVDDVRRGARTQPRAVSLARELASLRANPFYGAPMGYRTPKTKHVFSGEVETYAHVARLPKPLHVLSIGNENVYFRDGAGKEHFYKLGPDDERVLAALGLVRRQGRPEARGNPAYYGAPMGYRTTAPTSTTLLVRRVKIDRGGYAPDGAYFGIGKPVYVVTDADSGDVVETLRAYDHASAKDKVRAKYPNMKVK